MSTSSTPTSGLRMRIIGVLRRRFRNTWIQRLPGVSKIYGVLFRSAHRDAEVVIEFRGVELVLPTSDITMVPSLMQGDYEQLELDIFTAALRSGDVVFDVGANIGVYSLVACMAEPSATVFAFEPVPDNIALLQRNLDRAPGAAVTVVPKAVGSESGGTVDISIESNNIGTHSIRRDSGGVSVSVPTVSLDDFAAEVGVSPTVVKIDVEGYEPAVLAGAGAILAARPLLMIEFTPRLMSAAGFDPRVNAQVLLDAYGRIFVVDERHRRLRPVTTATALIDAIGNATSVNAVCVDEPDLDRLAGFVERGSD